MKKHCDIVPFFNLHFNMIFNTLFDTCRMTSLSTLKLSCWKLRASPTNMATNALKISKSNYAEPFNTPNMWKTMYHRPAQEQLLSKTLHPRINGRTQRLTGLVLVLGHCGTSEACDAGVLHRRARYYNRHHTLCFSDDVIVSHWHTVCYTLAHTHKLSTWRLQRRHLNR